MTFYVSFGIQPDLTDSSRGSRPNTQPDSSRGSRPNTQPDSSGDAGSSYSSCGGGGGQRSGQRRGRRRRVRRKTQPCRNNDSDDDVESRSSEGSSQVGSQDPAPSTEALPDVDPLEWNQLFKLLLSQFNGRTKLGTLMPRRGNLLQGFSYSQVADGLRRSNNFLLFEKDGKIKWVSVHSRKIRLCFNYKVNGTTKCPNDKCSFFHICRDFITGRCPSTSSCGLSHSFRNGSNAAVCKRAALQDFTDEEIHTIVLRSAAVVCEKFNAAGCIDDCPELHVCAQHIRKQCSDENCKFGHTVKGTDHNDWVLETFHMQKVTENTLQKMLLTQGNGSAADRDGDESHPGNSSVDKTMTGASLSQQKPATYSGANLTEQKPATYSGANLTEQKPATYSGANLTEQKPATYSGAKLTEQKPATYSGANLTEQKPATYSGAKLTEQKSATYSGANLTEQKPATYSGANLTEQKPATYSGAKLTEQKPATYSGAKLTEQKPATYSGAKLTEQKSATYSGANLTEQKPATYSGANLTEQKPATYSGAKLTEQKPATYSGAKLTEQKPATNLRESLKTQKPDNIVPVVKSHQVTSRDTSAMQRRVELLRRLQKDVYPRNCTGAVDKTDVETVRPVRPVPVETECPVPVETVRPVPVERVRPVPVERVRPVPVERVRRPVPVETVRPVPVATVRPVPVETVRPVRVETVCPVPVETVPPVPGSAGSLRQQTPATGAGGTLTEEKPATGVRGMMTFHPLDPVVVELGKAAASAGKAVTDQKFATAAAAGVLKKKQTECSKVHQTGSQWQETVSGSDTDLCEHYSWTGKCPRGPPCPRYHHPHRRPFVWQLHVFGAWHDLSPTDSMDIEERFCALAAKGRFEVFLPIIGGLQISLNFKTMSAIVNDGSDLNPGTETDVFRWSVPSYVDGDPDTALSLYSQWVWHYQIPGGRFAPFDSGCLQYTLEEKYLGGQQNYYFEVNSDRYLALLSQMMFTGLVKGSTCPLLRRPFQPLVDPGASVPLMCSTLLSKPPTVHQSELPADWCSVDHFQPFELVELERSSAERRAVRDSFRATLRSSVASIVTIFRVQNPALWDKFCTTKRSMAPREGSVEEVEERALFHGTPSLLAARGICTNSMDFRLAGDNVGARYGRGSYFSTTASYSHSYTHGPDRFMFRAKVLVGKYATGHSSYKKPPLREGLTLYDSCVNDEANPTIFVIFDLAQSYPEYLIQYKDAGGASPVHSQPASGHSATKTASSSVAQSARPQSATTTRAADAAAYTAPSSAHQRGLTAANTVVSSAQPRGLTAANTAAPSAHPRGLAAANTAAPSAQPRSLAAARAASASCNYSVQHTLTSSTVGPSATSYPAGPSTYHYSAAPQRLPTSSSAGSRGHSASSSGAGSFGHGADSSDQASPSVEKSKSSGCVIS